MRFQPLVPKIPLEGGLGVKVVGILLPGDAMSSAAEAMADGV